MAQAFKKLAAGVAPVHAREHRVAAALQREVELMADLRLPLDPLDEIRCDDDRLQRAQPHPRVPGTSCAARIASSSVVPSFASRP